MNSIGLFVGNARRATGTKASRAVIDLAIQMNGKPFVMQLKPNMPGRWDAHLRDGNSWKLVGGAKELPTRHMGNREIEMTFASTGERLILSPQHQDGSLYLVFVKPAITPPTPPTVKAATAKGVATGYKAKAAPLQRVTAALVEASVAVQTIAGQPTKEAKARAAKLEDLRAAQRGIERLMKQVEGEIAAEMARSITGGK